MENLVRGQADSQADASSTHDVELSTNDRSESRPTTSETTQERPEQTSENISLQQIEGAAVTSEFESRTPSVAEAFCEYHRLIVKQKVRKIWNRREQICNDFPVL